MTSLWNSNPLFGGAKQQQPAASMTPFGINNVAAASTNAGQQPSLLGTFGGSGTNGYFGQQQQQQPQQQHQQQQPQQQQPQQQQPQQPQPQATGAYFDTLLARNRRQAEDDGVLEELPALQLGLGDLRQRLRTIGRAGAATTTATTTAAGTRIDGGGVDARAQYLLAGSGVDPTLSARDIGGMIDIQPQEAPRSAGRGPAGEVDVETYLSNLQTRTTLGMIADGLDRSVRDFDNFLEDNVTMEWDAQRNRIYAHFGIRPRESDPAGGAAGGGGGGGGGGGAGGSGAETGGFGRSRRGRTQPGPGPGPGSGSGHGGGGGAGSSTFARSNLTRSVIGTPTKIGLHQTEFSDIERPSDASQQQSQAPNLQTQQTQLRQSYQLSSGVATDDRLLRDRQGKLAARMRQFNECRLRAQPFPILAQLAEAEKRSPDPHAPLVISAYRAVAQVVGEHADAEPTVDGPTARERQFARAYASMEESPGSADGVAMRRRILHGANRFLERQFLDEVETLITKHPHEARLGGLPDVVSKIKAYIRLRSARRDLVPDNTTLQQMNGEYVWAVVFYLLRSGHVNEAAHYINENQNQFKTIDRAFSTYLNSYAASEDRRLGHSRLRERIASEYTQRARDDGGGGGGGGDDGGGGGGAGVGGASGVDPFRMACYKVIGRCDLSHRNLDGLNPDVNDWIWLQFNLAREGDRTLEMAGEAYGLADLQAAIREVGQRHFPKTAAEDGTGSFGMFFYLQVLSGLYEDAVAYLYGFSYVDAVHFGIALAYYGLLRASDTLTAGNELRTYNSRGNPCLNFGRMLGYYTRDFRAADAVSAVDYLAFICLNADAEGEAGRRHEAVCHEAMRELVLETGEFSRLIGDVLPDGRRLRGIIEERGPLIGLAAEDDFVTTVALRAASFADDTGRTADAVLLYHLAGEYDAVVTIVSRALGEAISLEIGEDPMRLMPVRPRVDVDQNHRTGEKQDEPAAGSSLSLASLDDPVELARTMMQMYEENAMFLNRIRDQNQTACRILLRMSAIKGLVEQGHWTTSLDKIGDLDIIPTNANGDPSQIRTYAAKFASLPQPVAANVPNLIMWTVLCATRAREQLSAGGYSGNEGTRRMMIQRMRQITLDLTAYTSQLRYRFPPHLHEALARSAAE